MPRSLPAALCVLMAVASLAAHAQSDPPKVPLFDDLGRHHYAITTATPLAQRYFDQGLRLYYPDHPGANHFYIHAVEAVQPERALAAAERLAALMPGAGHIVHMPGHIYVRVGRYLDAIQANEHAIHADETYIRDHARAAACIRPATIRTTTTSWRSRRA